MDSALRLLHTSGVLRLAQWVNRHGLRILMYHRFPEAQNLEAHCRILRDHYRPLSMGAAADLLKSREPFPPNSVVVTVDDGHRDFFEIAYPVFSSYQIPVTVYLVTDFLDRRLWLWPDRVRHAFEHTGVPQVRFDPGDGRKLEFDLGTEAHRQHAARETVEALKMVSNEHRLAALGCLPNWLQVQIPDEPPRACEPLTWDEVRVMARRGIEFGAHTRSHPILSRVSTSEELAAEITGSKQRIEEVIGSPVRHFCYPNGLRRDIGSAAVEAVRLAGFETAVTTVPGVNANSDDALLLRRVAIDPRYEDYYFERRVSGFHVK